MNFFKTNLPQNKICSPPPWCKRSLKYILNHRTRRTMIAIHMNNMNSSHSHTLYTFCTKITFTIVQNSPVLLFPEYKQASTASLYLLKTWYEDEVNWCSLSLLGSTVQFLRCVCCVLFRSENLFCVRLLLISGNNSLSQVHLLPEAIESWSDWWCDFVYSRKSHIFAS